MIMLIGCSQALDSTFREEIIKAYRGWFPNSVSVHYQYAQHNDQLLHDLRQHLNRLQVIELAASPTHRHFVVPLNFQGAESEYGLKYGNNKNYFAAFLMPRESTTAVFDGLGAINGVPRKTIASKFSAGVALKAESYTIHLHVP